MLFTYSRCIYRFNLHIILKELNKVFLPHETTCYAFYKYHGPADEEDIYMPCIDFAEIMSHDGDTCLLIGRSAFCVQNGPELCTIKMNLENIRSSIFILKFIYY